MSYVKGARSGSEGNTRLQSEYGAGSEPPRQSYKPGYATGGAVASAPAAKAGSVTATGGSAKPMFGKAGKKVFKSGGKVKKEVGGPLTGRSSEWTGEGDSGKKLREQANDVRGISQASKGMSAMDLGIAAIGAMDRS